MIIITRQHKDARILTIKLMDKKEQGEREEEEKDDEEGEASTSHHARCKKK